MTMKRFVFILLVLIFQNGFSQSPPIIPYWAFGHWVWEDEKNTSIAVEALVNGYIKYNIPVDAIIIDSPWMNSYNDFVPDPDRYPNMNDLIGGLHQKGIRVLAFYTGCINSTAYQARQGKCKYFDYVVSNNFAVNRNKESTWFKGNGVHIDLTNEKAKVWWHTQVDKLYELKFNGAKIDFGFAWFGDTIQTSIGPLSKREFGYQYYGDAFDYNKSRDDEFVSMTYAWSGRGLMGFPSKSHVNWVGDFGGDWKGIKDQLKNIYLSANYGFSGIGCEIGGYWNVPSNKDQFIRYTQLSSLCPVMINGGSLGAFAHHLPWNYDPETLLIYQKYVNLHRQLSVYLFSTSVDANLGKGTIIKHASLENKNHFLGKDLFVQVICDSLKDVEINLPSEGKWIDYFQDDLIYGKDELKKSSYNLEFYPLFVKAGAIIPFASKDMNLLTDKQTIHIYPLGKSETIIHKPLSKGINYTDISVAFDEVSGILDVASEQEIAYTFCIKCFKKPDKVFNSDSWLYNNEDHLLTIEKKGKNFQLKIPRLKAYSSLIKAQ